MIFYAKKNRFAGWGGGKARNGGADCSPSPYFCYFETEGRMIVGYFNKTGAKFALRKQNLPSNVPKKFAWKISLRKISFQKRQFRAKSRAFGSMPVGGYYPWDHHKAGVKVLCLILFPALLGTTRFWHEFCSFLERIGMMRCFFLVCVKKPMAESGKWRRAQGRLCKYSYDG